MMENEDNEGKVHSSGYNVDELRLLFSCMKREPPGRMDRAGRFIAVIATKFVRHKPRKKKSAAWFVRHQSVIPVFRELTTPSFEFTSHRRPLMQIQIVE
jgi:hypothetical protein